jgi:glycosyltransferase involved in cell wall biosynthesis
MKILCVHNYYGSSAPSGENIVFENETKLLQRRGHEVVKFLRHSDEIRARGRFGVVQGALSTPWNPWSASSIRREVDCFKPDVVHVHNNFPLLSPAIFHTISPRAARVLTLHNYRLFCPAAIPIRAGRVCTECLDRKSSWPALRHGCYRGSRLATLPLALSVMLHRQIGTWTHQVDAFIALTEFQQKLMVEAGLPRDRVHVKPNFYAGNPQTVPWGQRGNYVVFVGRLSSEKGVADLIHAWLKWGESAPELRILGDGPLRESLQKMVSSVPGAQIRFLGQLPSTDTARQIAEARLMVVPSVWYETFGMVILEAFAHGTPVSVSNIGPLPAIVRNGASGLIFQPHDVESLFQEVRSAWSTPGLLERLGDAGRAEFIALYYEDANYEMLMNIYEAALAKRKG